MTRDTAPVTDHAAIACPDAAELRSMVAGRLTASRHEALESHILECARCQASLASVDDDYGSRGSLLRRFSEVAAQLLPLDGREKPSVPEIASATGPSERTLGDYRVIREIGRGGMGLVFEAEQISLRRRVALKTLPMAALLDPKRLQRFRNEAHAAALLHHPNIVPVYSFGVDHGVHYYAMQYIEGINLARVIRLMQIEAAAKRPTNGQGELEEPVQLDAWTDDPVPHGTTGFDPHADTATQGWDTDVSILPRQNLSPADVSESNSSLAELITARRTQRSNYFRRAAELAMQAAEALHFAHEQGVVHRDVKPSNLMIDATGRLWVTDFGLAHLESDATLTMSGDILGTLRYMSPEQSSGKPGRVDYRTDVYSLGATLYEMLTLEPLFLEADRQAILSCILNDEPRPLRTIDREIPADLETIVFKALTKEPLERYATAGEMADDLRRFLEDEPILARRPTRTERAFKWVRRHGRLVTVAASMLAVMLCLVVVGAALIAAAWQRESQQRQLAEEAAAEAKANSIDAENQREHAEKNFRRALQAVDEMFTQVGVSDLAEVPQMEPVRRALTQKALTFYQGFLAERSDDPSIAYETGRAWVRVGYVRRLLGELPEGLEAARQGMAIFERLDAAHSPESVHRLDMMMAYEEMAMNLMLLHRRAEALELRRNALALMETVVRDFPEPIHHWIRLADANSAYANVFNFTGRPMSQAEPFHRRALEILEIVRKNHPDEDLLAQFAHKSHWLGSCLKLQKKYEEAEVYLRRAVELREEQLRRNPNSAGVKHDLAHAISYYVQLPVPPGRESETELKMKRNLELTRELVRDFPDTADYAGRLSMAYRDYAGFLKDFGRYSESRDVNLEYIEHLKRIHGKFERDGGQRGDIAWAYYDLAKNFTELNLKPEARNAYQTALGAFEQLVAEVPHHLRGRWYLAVCLSECPDDEVADLTRGREMLMQIVAEAPEMRDYWNTLAIVECRLQNWQGMRDALEKSAALAREPVPVTEQFGLAIANWHLGAKDVAVEMYRSAAAETERLSLRDYDTRTWRDKARTTLEIAD